MQLVAFRIQNFRSIVDTGWHQLAHDNVTSLIGQNESGKTSILEGLKAFHDGRLIEDMVRSDLSLPIVSCRFRFDAEEIENRIEKKRLGPEIKKLIGSIESIAICRTWEDDMDSYMAMGEDLKEVYDESLDKIRKRESKVIQHLEKLKQEITDATRDLDKAREEADWTREKADSLRLRMNELKRQSRKLSSKTNKEQLLKELGQEEEMLRKLDDFRTEVARRSQAATLQAHHPEVSEDSFRR